MFTVGGRTSTVFPASRPTINMGARAVSVGAAIRPFDYSGGFSRETGT